jgi:hypothetical protein
MHWSVPPSPPPELLPELLPLLLPLLLPELLPLLLPELLPLLLPELLPELPPLLPPLLLPELLPDEPELSDEQAVTAATEREPAATIAAAAMASLERWFMTRSLSGARLLTCPSRQRREGPPRRGL